MAKRTFKPGEKAPTSGQYGRLLKGGKKSGNEVTVVKGEPFPPAPKKGQRYRLDDRTKH